MLKFALYQQNRLIRRCGCAKSDPEIAVQQQVDKCEKKFQVDLIIFRFVISTLRSIFGRFGTSTKQTTQPSIVMEATTTSLNAI